MDGMDRMGPTKTATVCDISEKNVGKCLGRDKNSATTNQTTTV